MGSFWIGKIVLRERSPSKVTPSEASGERAKARGLPNLTLVNNAVEPAETAGAWHSTCSHLDSARGRQETVSTQHAHQIPTLARPNTNFPRSSTAHLSMAQSACRRLPSPSPTTLPQTFALRALAPAPADGLRAVAFVFDDADAATEALAPSGLPGTVPPGIHPRVTQRCITAVARSAMPRARNHIVGTACLETVVFGFGFTFGSRLTAHLASSSGFGSCS